MLKRIFKKRQMDIEKASMLSAIMNGAEIFILLFLLLGEALGFLNSTNALWQPLLLVAVIVLIVEASLSIRDAFIWRDTHRQNEMLKEAWEQLENLNNQLRMQRHDFLNHFQVVYSLIDMDEKEEATKYIEDVYGQMRRFSSAMKTAKPGINALLQAKLADAQEKQVKVDLNITSDWKNLPMNDWEMCRVLGNIIDNAIDALSSVENKRLQIEIYEDLRAYGFRITNNGPMIPVHIQNTIFTLGFTTKQTGQGLGLHIVNELMQSYEGSIKLSSTATETSFEGSLPRAPAEQAEEAENAESVLVGQRII